mmetsp:Transcript_12507/g.36211  ORF Transcript_12507/g.36211 Transcript_12507/m.36211 type:complete len:579 (-) Transcript_12507:61-1797(-)
MDARTITITLLLTFGILVIISQVQFLLGVAPVLPIFRAPSAPIVGGGGARPAQGPADLTGGKTADHSAGRAGHVKDQVEQLESFLTKNAEASERQLGAARQRIQDLERAIAQADHLRQAQESRLVSMEATVAEMIEQKARTAGMVGPPPQASSPEQASVPTHPSAPLPPLQPLPSSQAPRIGTFGVEGRAWGEEPVAVPHQSTSEAPPAGVPELSGPPYSSSWRASEHAQSGPSDPSTPSTLAAATAAPPVLTATVVDASAPPPPMPPPLIPTPPEFYSDADVLKYDDEVLAAKPIDLQHRRQALPQPVAERTTVSLDDVLKRKRQWGSLGDLLIEESTKMIICPIEKVASSEWRKLIHRIQKDLNWRQEPWFKDGGLERLKRTAFRDRAEEILNDPSWTKMVFFRNPYERLVSCYNDKFTKGDARYALQLSNRTKTEMSFNEFVDVITHPLNTFHNAHWRPQHRFCGLTKFLHLFNFVGNFESLQSHAETLLRGADLWEPFGATGWGPSRNGSMFQKNQARHRNKSQKSTVEDHLPVGSRRRTAVYQYYREDFELFSRIKTPPFQSDSFAEELSFQM